MKFLSKTNSKRQIEKVLISEDWIENYSITQKPFSNKIFIRIKNREPILVLNDEFFYDKHLYKFKYDKSKNEIISVDAPDDFAEQILEIIARVEKIIKLKLLNIVTNGWDVKTDKFFNKIWKGYN